MNPQSARIRRFGQQLPIDGEGLLQAQGLQKIARVVEADGTAVVAE
jgi:hypothetical protein